MPTMPFIHSHLHKNAGVELPDVKKVEKGIDYNGSIILAPPAVEDSSWTKIFAEQEEDLRRVGVVFVDQERERMWIEALVLVDHADWSGLIDVITGTGAEEIMMTHGNGESISRYLTEKGIKTEVLADSVFQREEME